MPVDHNLSLGMFVYAAGVLFGLILIGLGGRPLARRGRDEAASSDRFQGSAYVFLVAGVIVMAGSGRMIAGLRRRLATRAPPMSNLRIDRAPHEP
jgi:hypothetical protein